MVEQHSCFMHMEMYFDESMEVHEINVFQALGIQYGHVYNNY